jgi:hypothetical protein
MSVNNYHAMPSYIPEERRSDQHCGGSMKLKETSVFYFTFPPAVEVSAFNSPHSGSYVANCQGFSYHGVNPTL